MSATSRLNCGRGSGAGAGPVDAGPADAGPAGAGPRKFGGVVSPRVELSQSLRDMPARRAAASALSRTDGSMPSILHTREFMIPSGSAPALHPAPSASPRVPDQTIEFGAGRLPQ